MARHGKPGQIAGHNVTSHSKEKPPKQYPAGRICVTCGARLSRYNPGEQCGTHDDPRDYRILTRHSTRK